MERPGAGQLGGGLDGAHVVINIAGRSVNCRYTEAHRREIMESRLRTTQLVGLAIAQVRNPPRSG